MRANSGGYVYLDVIPEGQAPIPVAFVDRDRLGPAEPHVPRGDTELLYIDEEETPDVPGTDPEPVPDVPGTDPEPVPDVPGTNPEPLPDVPPVPGTTLLTTPNVTADVNVVYFYDPVRLNKEATLVGQDA